MSQYCDRCGAHFPNDRFSEHLKLCPRTARSEMFENVICEYCDKSIAYQAYEAHLLDQHEGELERINGYLRPGLSSTMTQRRAIGMEFGQLIIEDGNRALAARADRLKKTSPAEDA